ncbi:hypothetical protein RhiirA5_436909 [Rhizophagus irregularis]|uniref:Uncharacterized protein n=1 Tax=Rhizophagus irregularis TaxID=588596 RepID=A0A2N0NL78_9GLOM|nr:hypothetical protein RhiirA5_436909 [Rhizophagus irregularis]
MDQNTYQNNQNNLTFSNLQSNVIQPEHSSSNNNNIINMNVNPSNNIFPTFHTNNNFSGQQPISNENNASTSPIVSSYVPQQYYVGPQQPIVNTSPLNSFNMTSNPTQSEILSFDIPGFKIIFIPTFSQQSNTHLNCSSDITNTQFTQFQR